MNDTERYKRLQYALAYGMAWRQWAYIQGYELAPSTDWLP